MDRNNKYKSNSNSKQPGNSGAGFYTRVPNSLMAEVRDGVITAQEHTVYVYLLSRQGNNNNLWASIETIAGDTGYSVPQISRMLKNLEGAGHIRRKRRSHNSTITECLTRAGVNPTKNTNSAVWTPKTDEKAVQAILERSMGTQETEENDELNGILQLSANCENKC